MTFARVWRDRSRPFGRQDGVATSSIAARKGGGLTRPCPSARSGFLLGIPGRPAKSPSGVRGSGSPCFPARAAMRAPRSMASPGVATEGRAMRAPSWPGEGERHRILPASRRNRSGERVTGDGVYCWLSSVAVGGGASVRRTAQRPELRSEKKIVPLCGWAPHTWGAFGRKPSGSSGRKRAISRPCR